MQTTFKADSTAMDEAFNFLDVLKFIYKGRRFASAGFLIGLVFGVALYFFSLPKIEVLASFETEQQGGARVLTDSKKINEAMVNLFGHADLSTQFAKKYFDHMKKLGKAGPAQTLFDDEEEMAFYLRNDMLDFFLKGTGVKNFPFLINFISPNSWQFNFKIRDRVAEKAVIAATGAALHEVVASYNTNQLARRKNDLSFRLKEALQNLEEASKRYSDALPAFEREKDLAQSRYINVDTVVAAIEKKISKNLLEKTVQQKQVIDTQNIQISMNSMSRFDLEAMLSWDKDILNINELLKRITALQKANIIDAGKFKELSEATIRSKDELSRLRTRHEFLTRPVKSAEKVYDLSVSEFYTPVDSLEFALPIAKYNENLSFEENGVLGVDLNSMQRTGFIVLWALIGAFLGLSVAFFRFNSRSFFLEMDGDSK